MNKFINKYKLLNNINESDIFNIEIFFFIKENLRINHIKEGIEYDICKFLGLSKEPEINFVIMRPHITPISEITEIELNLNYIDNFNIISILLNKLNGSEIKIIDNKKDFLDIFCIYKNIEDYSNDFSLFSNKFRVKIIKE